MSLFRRRSKKFQSLSRRQQLRRIKELTKVDEQVFTISNEDLDTYSDHVLVNQIGDREGIDIDINVSSDNNQLSTDNSFNVNSDIGNNSYQNLEVSDQFNFREDLRNWAIEQNIPHLSLDILLKLLHGVGHTELPLTARTLLKTPKSNDIIEMGNGHFSHYGLEKALVDQLGTFDSSTFTSNIFINLNIDGLPLSRSSKSQLWPILGQIHDSSIKFRPFIISAYHGPDKPLPLEQYLNPFLEEYTKLNTDGFYYKNRLFKVYIRSICADTPGRNHIRNFPPHNSRCGECVQEGVTISHRRLFLEINSDLRSDTTFRENIPEKYAAPSPFEAAGISMTTQFPLDYMHLLCLGVMKKLLIMWLSRFSNTNKIHQQLFNNIDQLYCNMTPYIPEEFARKPRTLREIKQWKATEFRLFLLYTGPLILRFILNEKELGHFNLLNCAIRILSDQFQCVKNNAYAHQLLIDFVEEMRKIYGDLNIIYNVHNLLHLARYVLLLNAPLDSFSCFPFEDFLFVLKNTIRSGNLPLSQLMNRAVEHAKKPTNFLDKPLDRYQLFKRITSTLPPGYYNAFSKINFSDFSLSTKLGNNCCYLKDKSVVLLEFICHYNSEPVIVGRQVVNPVGIENYPLDSRKLGIIQVDELSELQHWKISEVEKKGVVVSCSSVIYIFPMIHTNQ